MTRIDFQIQDKYVATTWVKEDGNTHSMLGRLLFKIEDFSDIKSQIEKNPNYYFNEKLNA